MYLEALCLELPKYEFEEIQHKMQTIILSLSRMNSQKQATIRSFEGLPFCFCFSKKALKALQMQSFNRLLLGIQMTQAYVYKSGCGVSNKTIYLVVVLHV